MPVTTTRIVPFLEKAELSVNTTPVKGDVAIDGKRWGKAPLLGQFAAGSYEISFGDVEGYDSPGSERVTLRAGVLTGVTAEYKGAEERRLRVTYA